MVQKTDPHSQCFSMHRQVTSDGAVLLRQLEEGGTDSDEAAAAKEGVLAVDHGQPQWDDQDHCCRSGSCCRQDWGSAIIQKVSC